MAVTGVLAPRVVVRPPSVPAPPPISLLTQNNVVDDDRDLVDESQADRWVGGGGTIWTEPVRQSGAESSLWQQWPDLDAGGVAGTTKGGSVHASPASTSPIQLPLIATLLIEQGVLAAAALDGTPEQQAVTALMATMPRIVEHELWAASGASGAGWADQFRLKALGRVSTLTNTAQPYLTALALAEQAAADQGWIDGTSGAMVHVSTALFGLITSYHQGLQRAVTGRQWTTPSGCLLVCEPGASGTWAETATPTIAAKPGGAAAGDNLAAGWMFVTPPVRVRLGGPAQVLRGEFELTNDQTLLVERPFILEASMRTTCSVAIPVDYTQES